jgi:hypothetical protein
MEGATKAPENTGTGAVDAPAVPAKDSASGETKK